MKRPTQAVFGPIEWTVKFTSSLGDLSGRTRQLEGCIDVATEDRSHVQQQLTLLHELLHAAIFGTALRGMKEWDDDIEEVVVTAIEGPLLELLQRPENASALEWLR